MAGYALGKMIRFFIIVAKDRPDLYEYFRAAFAELEQVTVLRDRRLRIPPFRLHPEDRGPAGPDPVHPDERRRVGGDVYDELSLRGFVIVKVTEGALGDRLFDTGA